MIGKGKVFNPSRLTLARKRRGMTMSRLAKIMDVEPRSVSGWEKGEFGCDQVDELAKALSFPASFFLGEDLEQPHPHSASFRAMSKMTAAQRDMALGSGAIALALNAFIESRFELPAADLPIINGTDPESAAIGLRRQWGLGELPIKNVVHLLESKGVRVFSLAVDTAAVNAFSMWRGNTAFVFLNTMKSAENSRFDAAHELGHLVMHRHGPPQGQSAEREADAFASAFLMPRASLFARRPTFATVDHLIRLKKYWTVSVAALAYRLHAIGAISDWHYRSLFVEISSRGYRTEEPEGSQRETSQVLAKIFAALREDGISKIDIANELCVPVEEIDQLVFGLALTVLAGRRSRGRSNRKRPQLRIVS